MLNRLLKIYENKDQKRIFDLLQCKTYVYVAVQLDQNIYRISTDMDDPQSLVNQIAFDHSEDYILNIHYVNDCNKTIRIIRHLLNIFAIKRYCNFKVETWYKLPEDFDKDSINNLIVEIDNQHDPGYIAKQEYENIRLEECSTNSDDQEDEFFVELFG